MDLSDALHAVRHSWWVLLAAVLLGLGAAVVLVANATPVYESSTRLFVSSSDHHNLDASHQGLLYARERSASYVRALRGEELAARVVRVLDLRLPASEVAGKVTAVVSPNSAVVEVTVADGSAERAHAIAATLADEFTRWVSQVEGPPGSAAPRVAVTSVEAANLPTRPASPDLDLLLGLCGSVGLLVGLWLTVWGRWPWNAVTSGTDVRRLTHAPLIGVLPDGQGGPDDAGDEGATARSIRGIRRNLGLLADGGTPRVVVLAGVAAGDGSPSLARVVAEDLARAGGRVVLVEADRRRAGVHEIHVPAGTPGFFDVLAGSASLAEAVRHEPGGQLSVVPPGRAPADPDQLLGSARLRGLLHALRASRDVVIIDAPPVLSLPDAARLGAVADGCLLVARHRRTRRGQLTDAADALSAAGADILAVVLTGVTRPGGPARASYRYRADAERGGAAAVRRAIVTPHV